MTDENAPEDGLRPIVQRLVRWLRGRTARIERRTVERVGITDPTRDEPTIFITIDTDGEAAGPNVTDGIVVEQLHFTEEDDIAELLAHRD